MRIYAWIGEDEFGSGQVGIKQGIVPAGCIPLAVMDYDRAKLAKLAPQMEAQAKMYGKRIYLAVFVLAEVMLSTNSGEPAGELEKQQEKES